MSAIFGIVHWDGRPVDAGDLARVDAALAPYGSDRGGIWRDGHVGLGHRLHCTVPEDRFDRQPIRCGDSNAVLVADARIDNRDDLRRQWSFGSDAPDWPDSAFVSHAVAVWGERAVDRLQGPFAFAHWDGRGRRLLLARSPFGERSLFYHSSPRTFAFASRPKGLFALRVVSRELDEPVLADFLAVERPDQTASFFRGVRRVPGGHLLIVTETGQHLRPFWQPDLLRELRLPSDEAYVEAFVEIYQRAVRDALRSVGTVGVMVSGGLDSSSVTALAAPILAARGERLAGFTQVPSEDFAGPIRATQYADETPFVEALARRYDNIGLRFIRPDGRFHLENANERYSAAEAPTGLPLVMAWWDALMADAQRQGVGVMLNGVCGNYTVSYGGDGLLSQMVAHGRWRDAWREARAIRETNGGISAPRILIARGVMPLLPTWMYLAVQHVRTPGAPVRQPWRAFAAINPEFAALHRVSDRAGAQGDDTRRRLERDTRKARMLVLPRVGAIFDGQSSGYQARFGIDVRDPTADIRVAEFCLSLPEDQYQRNGQGRWLIRRAMANRLPADILQNPKRGLQVADWSMRLLPHRARLLDEIRHIETSDLARRAIDLPQLRRLVEAMPRVNPADRNAVANYRGVLDLGLEAGRFILWAEAAGAREATA